MLNRLLLLEVVIGLVVGSCRLNAQVATPVNLAWNASSSSEVTSYAVHYGTTSGVYSASTNVGNQTSASVTGLQAGQTYYLVVCARNAAGIVSDPSNEVSHQTPSATLPVVALTALVAGANYSSPATIACAASVTANGHTITKVQFYNGAVLLGEDTTSPYAFTWSNVAAGSYSLTARAVYDAGSTTPSASVNVAVGSVTSVTSLWPGTTAPGIVDAGVDNPVELGVKFRSDVAGNITGIRFYKASANIGTHVGNLWTSTGTLLATATFTSETGSGWQQVNFSTPVPITSSTVYVASYHVNNGHYSLTPNYFLTTGVDNAPLHALADGVSGGNGVYAYGTNSIFPNQTWSGANYWVDVVFQGGASPSPALTTIVVTPANTTVLAGATQSLTATGNYSDGSTQNLTSLAAWSSAQSAVVTVNASGLVTAVSAGTTTLSATLTGITGSSTLTVVVTPPANPPTIALTSPTNGASYTSPATVNLASSITANGHSITKVQFFNGSVLLGEDTTAPYDIAWNNVIMGNYALKARAVYDSGSTVDSASINIVVADLPAPWQTVDVGAVGQVGSVSQSNNIFTVSGAGWITGTTDSFRFVHQSLSADGEIKARLTSVQANNTNGSFGVMMRDNLSPGSKYVFMGMAQDLNYRWQRRSTSSGSTSTKISTASTPPDAWVRLVRSGSTFTGYMSSNGVDWTPVNTRSISMATNIYVGFVVASGNTNSPNSAAFSSGFVVP